MSTQCNAPSSIPAVDGDRRSLLKVLSGGLAIAASASALPIRSVSAAQTDPAMAIVVFVLYRKAGLTHEQSVAEWNGERHIAVVKQVPGLKRWIQNHVTSAPSDTAPDGIGELWFDSAKDMEQAMSSPQMGAAVEDAKRFLDMERSYAVVVDGKTIIA